ncbi:hypothetical protein AB433_14305 [Croceicoccus naphthovorans]|uniref:Uncharacterized protein n=1 Tax=Croceicoccus naphthovorans TaxID=1348774 RepID=A0A0G3XI40_9SPHN|nr:hypothetical protein AB433_14305 [Croceicoccus naphthovorans]
MAADPSHGWVSGGDDAMIAFHYVREDYSCNACEAPFARSRITSCPPEHIWSARSALARIRSEPNSRRAIPLWWEGHPELSDFSAPFAKGSQATA